MSAQLQSRPESLQERIDAFQSHLATQLPPDTAALLDREINAMLRERPGAHALRTGALAPDFELPSTTGSNLALSATLREGPAVVVFFRGSWCPYCDLQLRAYQEVTRSITGAHATLVAVSPQTLDHSSAHAQKGQFTFPVLFDRHNATARKYGLVFDVSAGMQTVLRGFGIDVGVANGADSWELPVPAVYIVDTAGKIRFDYVDPDYRKRLEPEELLERLQSAVSPS